MPPVRPRPIALISAVLGIFALVAPAAHAGLLVPTAAGCAPEVLEQPFLPWGDPAHYVLSPDGGFEAGAAGWSLSGAGIVADNESFDVHAPGERAALELQPGARRRRRRCAWASKIRPFACSLASRARRRAPCASTSSSRPYSGR